MEKIHFHKKEYKLVNEEYRIIFRHWINKLIWLTLTLINIETIFHVFHVDHFLCSAATEGKAEKMSPLGQEKNIRKSLQLIPRAVQQAEIRGVPKARTKRGSAASVTADTWKSRFAVPVRTLHGGWGGAVCWSGQTLARMLLWSCWSETHEAPTGWNRVQQNQILTPHCHGEAESQFPAWLHRLGGNGCTEERSLWWACFSSAQMVGVAARLVGHAWAHLCSSVSSITSFWSKFLIYGSLFCYFFLTTQKAEQLVKAKGIFLRH